MSVLEGILSFVPKNVFYGRAHPTHRASKIGQEIKRTPIASTSSKVLDQES